MKKVLALALAIFFSGCGASTPEPEIETTTYITSGRYYVDGTVITEDGNEWGYSQDIISESESYDDEPIFAIFDDKGTPDNIYDDEILGLVLDRETAIYDALEVSLSQNFTVERNGNYLIVEKGN